MTNPTPPADGTDHGLSIPNRYIPSPAARAWIYGVVAAVLALLVAVGVIAPDVSGHILGIASAVLGIAVSGLALSNTPR